MPGSYWFTTPPPPPSPRAKDSKAERRRFVVGFEGSMLDMTNYPNRVFQFPVSELTTFESRGNRTDLSKVYLSSFKVTKQANSFNIPVEISIEGLPENSSPNTALVIPSNYNDKNNVVLVDFPLTSDKLQDNFNFMELKVHIRRFDGKEWNVPPKKGALQDKCDASIQIDMLYKLIHTYDK